MRDCSNQNYQEPSRVLRLICRGAQVQAGIPSVLDCHVTGRGRCPACFPFLLIPATTCSTPQSRTLPQFVKVGHRVGPVSPLLTLMLSPDTGLTGSLCLMSFISNFQERTSKSSNYEVIIKLLVSAKVPTIVGSDPFTMIPVSFCCVLLFPQVEMIMLPFSIPRMPFLLPSWLKDHEGTYMLMTHAFLSISVS